MKMQTVGMNLDKKKPNQFGIKIVHGHKQDSFENQFIASVTFSILLGIVMFLAGVKK